MQAGVTACGLRLRRSGHPSRWLRVNITLDQQTGVSDLIIAADAENLATVSVEYLQLMSAMHQPQEQLAEGIMLGSYL